MNSESPSAKAGATDLYGGSSRPWWSSMALSRRFALRRVSISFFALASSPLDICTFFRHSSLSAFSASMLFLF